MSVGAAVCGAGALLYLFTASRAMRRGDRRTAQADATLASLALLIGGAGLLLVRLMLP
jgi:hypothetical protein